MGTSDRARERLLKKQARLTERLALLDGQIEAGNKQLMATLDDAAKVVLKQKIKNFEGEITEGEAELDLVELAL